MSTTTKRSVAAAPSIDVLIGSFRRDLRARNKAPRTIQSYEEACTQFAAFLSSHGMPMKVTAIKREHVESYIVEVLDHYKPTTATARYKSLQQFFRFLVEDGELAASPMAKMHPPAIPEKSVPVLKVAEIKALLDTCKGGSFEDLRDQAIIRVFYDTGLRLSELVNLKVTLSDIPDVSSDVDLDDNRLHVLRKGRRPGEVRIGAKTVKALDRYVRVRSAHADSDEPWLWLGRRGHMTQSGVQQMLRQGADKAGLEHLNPHQFRHTFSHEYLTAGGSPENLMAITGLRSRSMLQRYAASTQIERAREEHKRLSPGDRV